MRAPREGRRDERDEGGGDKNEMGAEKWRKREEDKK